MYKRQEWARAGKVILPLLQNMLSDPYFSQPAPKSTGREYFNYGWLERHLRHFPGVDPRDVQATLAELTAVTISEQVLLSGGCERLMVCGGAVSYTHLDVYKRQAILHAPIIINVQNVRSPLHIASALSV